MTVAAIIVAAGRGLRAGEGLPKQFRSVGGVPVIARSINALLSAPEVALGVVVIHEVDRAPYDECLSHVDSRCREKLLPPVSGGETRQDSVRSGLDALRGSPPEIVLVHDAARPFASVELVGAAIEAGRKSGAAIPGIPVADTIKLMDEDGRVVETLQRSRLRAVQTPQSFAYKRLLDAHHRAVSANLRSFTDDGALIEWAGFPVLIFPGDPANVKLTHPADFERAGAVATSSPEALVTRLGTGLDVHAFGEGDHVMLGGVRVPHSRGVIAHSDGDVVLHALTDAILGALADGDIGIHFPPSDPQWKGASSDRFLAYAADRVRSRRGIIDHLDVTLLCEAPRLAPHREAMRSRIAEIAGIPIAHVSLKATTTEKLGFTGRGEGLAAQAAATVRLPETSP
jgi:2-C-methyl-D-erythritol 4-phosphate cytidylyltransferase/2-C-methyl-D-erythritol 2,4-cyclodiphosphate synthase